jgi:uncharacterized protein YbbC (DUF1343 family)
MAHRSSNPLRWAHRRFQYPRVWPMYLLLATGAVFAMSATPLAAQGSRPAGTLTGIDVLEQMHYAPLRGKRVGLITNQTGVDRNGRSTIDLLAGAPGVRLVALFSPEHGIRGDQDEKIDSGRDAATGLPVYSLYGDTLRPSDAMLDGLDALVFDMQDAGVRFYTYVTTMGYAMEAAARHRLPFYVLDRPNPLGGLKIEGPMLDRARLNFVGYFPTPVRMAMTLGEMARMFNAENKIGCDLRIIAMKNWRRADWFDATGLPWVNPSPNLHSLDAEALYPGLEILQSAGVSVGRGTPRPFELFGAPWIHAPELAERLNGTGPGDGPPGRGISGVRFAPAEFTPTEGLYAGERCEGLAITVTDRSAVESMRMGLEIAAALAALYPDRFDVARTITLLGHAETVERLRRGDAPDAIVRSWTPELAAFSKMRARYLLYR